MNIQEDFLTTSNWIKIEIYSSSFENLSYYKEEHSYDNETISILESLFDVSKRYNLIDEFGQSLAYLYQFNKCKAILRKKVIEDVNFDEAVKICELGLIKKEMKLISSIDSFAMKNKITALGSVGIELGTSACKDFSTSKIFLTLKIYLENIYKALFEFISNYSTYDEARNLGTLLKEYQINDTINLIYLQNYIKNHQIKDQEILESVMGSELLILSSAISERNLKESLYALISLIKTKDLEIVEKGLFNFYKMIDTMIENTLNKIGFDLNNSKELVSRIKFASRKLC